MEYTGETFNGVSLIGLDCPFEGRAKSILGRIKRRLPIPLDLPRGIRLLMGFPQNNYNGIPWTKARGYRFDDDSIPVMCTWHPGYIGAGKTNLIPVVIHDILRATEELSLDAPKMPLEDLVLFPTLSNFRTWLHWTREHSAYMAYDIETAYSREHEEDEEEQDPSYEITRISLGRDDGGAITVPYIEPYIQEIRLFLDATYQPLVGWNSHEFDNPRVRAAGWEIDRHRLIDARWLWHFLQPTLPQGLGTVTTFYARVPEWKSIGSSQDAAEAELYSALDAWATVKCYEGIKNALSKRRLL